MQIQIKNKLNTEELFRIKRMKEVIKATNPHGHKDYLEIIYLEAGAGTHQIDFKNFEVKPFSLYLVMPGQIHSWNLTEIPKGFVIMVQKDFLLDHPLYELIFLRFPVLFSSGYELEHIRETVSTIFLSIVSENDDKKPNHEAVIQTYLLLLFNLLKREMKTGEPAPFSNLLKDFFSLLEHQYATGHEVAAYAGQLHITPKTLNNACRKFLNKTAGEVINERLTVESKKLLLYSVKTLTEIAYELGFTDPSHFNKFFKRRTGVLPGIYRKGIS